MPKTYIREFPHPSAIIHFHPRPYIDGEFKWEHIQSALEKKVHSIELDLRLHYGDDGPQVFVSHDEPKDDSPTLEYIMRCLMDYKGKKPTVHDDGLQFFVALDLKSNNSSSDDELLFEIIYKTLEIFSPHLSTSVSAGDSPRGVTIIITGGDMALKFYDYIYKLFGQSLNCMCIVEGHDYNKEICSRSSDPYQWAPAVEHPHEEGSVNKLHKLDDKNIRVFFAKKDRDLNNMKLALAAGADSINSDSDQIEAFRGAINSQEPRGQHPSLSLNGSNALISWHGANSTNLYIALGAGFSFSRQICLTYLLDGCPKAIAPKGILMPDRRILLIYEGAAANDKLWYISGRFKQLDKFLIFDGAQKKLTQSNKKQRGSDPSIAFAPDGRLVIVYEGTSENNIWYVTGELNADGNIVGKEFELSQNGSRRGKNPSIAFAPDRRLVIVYEGTSEDNIWYVTGKLSADGDIVGQEFELSQNGSRRGKNPSIAFAPDGRLVIVYEGTSENNICYVTGELNADGNIVGKEFELGQNGSIRGLNPTVAFDDENNLVILYQNTTHEFWYFLGCLEPSGVIVGENKRLNIGPI